MSNFIVFGSLGFIGSNLSERLLEDGHNVFGVDNISTGTNENLDMLEKHDRFNFLKLDITDKSDLDYLSRYLTANNDRIDCVFMLSGVARIQPAILNPQLTHDTNVTGMFNVLEFMRKSNITNIVFSSSSSIYGLANKCPLKEDMPPDCLNVYSLSKYVSEQYIKTWCKLYGMNGVCLRYFNVFGQREVLAGGDFAPVVGLFFRQLLLEKKPLTIVGDGLQRRAHTHVFDVVDANLKAAEQCMKGIRNRFHGEVFNIGTEKNYSMIELADIILDSLGMNRERNKIFISQRVAELRETSADISKAKKILGWEPKISLEEYIDKHRDYYYKRWGRC
ncbi:SDR family NAD(P)-dependent oxidoreductase [Candidatus Pacearchaeota archaeon]|nr:SDR family NAD(P)-dependent oxidoreductase [Candidatus Pacearchaeota archaeon]